MMNFGMWCVELFKTGCCCAIVFAAYVYLFWLISDTFTSWRGGYQYVSWEYFVFGIFALVTLIFGGWVLFIGW